MFEDGNISYKYLEDSILYYLTELRNVRDLFAEKMNAAAESNVYAQNKAIIDKEKAEYTKAFLEKYFTRNEIIDDTEIIGGYSSYEADYSSDYYSENYSSDES